MVNPRYKGIRFYKGHIKPQNPKNRWWARGAPHILPLRRTSACTRGGDDAVQVVEERCPKQRVVAEVTFFTLLLPLGLAVTGLAEPRVVARVAEGVVEPGKHVRDHSGPACDLQDLDVPPLARGLVGERHLCCAALSKMRRVPLPAVRVNMPGTRGAGWASRVGSDRDPERKREICYYSSTTTVHGRHGTNLMGSERAVGGREGGMCAGGGQRTAQMSRARPKFDV